MLAAVVFEVAPDVVVETVAIVHVVGVELVAVETAAVALVGCSPRQDG